MARLVCGVRIVHDMHTYLTLPYLDAFANNVSDQSQVGYNELERWKYRIQGFLSFMQHKSPEIGCNLGIVIFSLTT